MSFHAFRSPHHAEVLPGSPSELRFLPSVSAYSFSQLAEMMLDSLSYTSSLMSIDGLEFALLVTDVKVFCWH